MVRFFRTPVVLNMFANDSRYVKNIEKSSSLLCSAVPLQD
jgi:hypothetical protein